MKGSGPSHRHVFFGWTQILLASLAMVMTIPGRTQGLGLITQSLLHDPSLELQAPLYAWLNLLATLGGAIFALPFGWLIDKAGIRLILTVNLVLLGVATWLFAQSSGLLPFFAGMLFMRGFGQSALSTSSLTLIGKWFPGRAGVAMAAFGIVSTIGFIGIFETIRHVVRSSGWREAWTGLAIGCAILSVLSWILCRNPLSTGKPSENASATKDESGMKWREALRTPLFWLLALSSALFNWVSSGIGLFNEDVLAERGFGPELYERALAIMTVVTLLSNGAAGWLSTRWPLIRLMAVGMLLLGMCLVTLPLMTQEWHVYVNAVFMGTSAGFVIVVFFACWATHFGTRQLGRIQGSAQAMTVLASAMGPVSLALSKQLAGSFRELFFLLAGLAFVSAICCMRLTHTKATDHASVR